MRKSIFLIYFCLSISSAVIAQESVLPEGNDTAQWMAAFEEVKSQIKVLLDSNNRLNDEYQALQVQIPKMQQTLEGQAKKNEDLRQFLRDRNGKTDQQVRIEQLNDQIKLQKSQLSARVNEESALAKRSEALMRRVSNKKAKVADWDLHQNAGQDIPAQVKVEIPTVVDPELQSLRKELESQKAQEAQLEDELASLGNAQMNQKRINQLEEKLAQLKRQKADLIKYNAPDSSVTSAQRFVFAGRKAELESKIQDFEARINTLRGSVSKGVAWGDQKKKLIHDIVQADARNGQMRSKIEGLREDIMLLRDQVASLQKRLSFSQGKGKSRY